MTEIPIGFFTEPTYDIDPSDPNDFEGQQKAFEGQFSYNSRSAESGNLDSIFSPGFSQVPHSEMYRAWLYPDLYPNERQPVLSNWPDEDLEAFCGIYDRKDIP